jgi:gamma-glutamyl hercynylcysteine S-oxide synthase
MKLQLTLSHEKVYEMDIDKLVQLEEKFELEYLDGLTVDEIQHEFDYIMPIIHSIEHPVVAEYVFGMAIGHPHTYVRYRLVDFIEKWLPYFSAVEAIIRLTHDPDDLVSFRAIEICGKEKLEESYKFLSPIIGEASMKITKPNKPVGLGAQKVLTSLIDLLGTENMEELNMIEQYYQNNGHLFNKYDVEEKIPTALLEEFYKLEEDGMILVPGGYFTYGLDSHQIPDKTFGWDDASPAQKVWLPPFFIDKYPTTNTEYEEFVNSTKADGHIFCHPNEPEEKEHRRNTYWDKRFKPNHPVTGIDWYDAFAYARWKGKELPTEFQWEKAARGNDGRVWPWGNSFEEHNTNWSGTWLKKKPMTLKDWRVGITQFSETIPPEPIKEATTFENTPSPYGVVGMIGNHWEWTRSDLATKRNFHPSFNDKIGKDSKKHAFAVLKGGSFFSMPGLMYPSYRGKDIPFCRHNEMGFRCVKNIPIHKIKNAIKKPLTNRAVY